MKYDPNNPISDEEWESIKEIGKQNEEQIKKRWHK